jgi:hypothetical protein
VVLSICATNMSPNQKKKKKKKRKPHKNLKRKKIEKKGRNGSKEWKQGTNKNKESFSSFGEAEEKRQKIGKKERGAKEEKKKQEKISTGKGEMGNRTSHASVHASPRTTWGKRKTNTYKNIQKDWAVLSIWRRWTLYLYFSHPLSVKFVCTSCVFL